MTPRSYLWAACFAAAALHMLLCEGRALVYQADDYTHLLLAHDRHLGWAYLADVLPWMSRVPLWALQMFALFAGPLWLESLLIFVYGLCHVTALVSLACFLRRQIFGHARPITQPLYVACVVVVVAMWPSSNEILYWRTCMPYALGGVFVGAALHARSASLRIGLLVAATLTYETFLLPSLALLCLEHWGPHARAHRFSRLVQTALVTVGLVAFVRGVAGLFVGSFTHLTDLSWQTFNHRAEEALRFVFGLPAAVGVMAGLWCLLSLVCNGGGRAKTRQVLMWLVACYLSTAPYWVLVYPASRAVYGAQLMYGAGVIALVWQASEAPRTKALQWAILGLVAILCVQAQGEEFVARRHNRFAIAALEQALGEALLQCGDPCVVHHEDLRATLATGWVLPPFCWDDFIARLADARLVRGPVRLVTTPAVARP